MASDTTGPSRRGRVVMLVDNGVVNDSRVQKAARSAAALGWDVTLLGSTPGPTETWQLDGATVQLITTPRHLLKRRPTFRHAGWRRPLAYRGSQMGNRQLSKVRGWIRDIEFRQDLLALDANPDNLRKLALQVERVIAGIQRRWVSLRRLQLRHAIEARNIAGLPSRLYYRFWQAVQGDRCWRRLEPSLWDFELAFAPIIDALEPDLIHAHDFRMVGVGARATVRARAAGRPVKFIYDAHEYLPGVETPTNTERWSAAHTAYEREYLPYADAIITVADKIADMLHADHELAEKPPVMLNVPPQPGPAEAGDPSLRERCGLDPDVPLLVYSGGAAEQRGLRTMVQAMPGLPEVHVAFVINTMVSPFVKDMVALAEELGVRDRLHLTGFVRYDKVINFLSSATIGVIPAYHWVNHELSLNTKFFEYSHARLPLVVSDVKTIADMVTSTGQGEVFTSQDVPDFIRAVRAILADPKKYQSAYDEPGRLDSWTWESQAAILDTVYSRLLDAPQLVGPRKASQPAVEATV